MVSKCLERIKYKPMATIVLLFMTVIFLIAYPYKAYVWGAFIMHMSGAAMIGGLADWYGVTALFSKPLGISYKTAILPRSKDRLILLARRMLSEEILRVSYMYKIIKKERLMKRILQYVVSSEGQAQGRVILHSLADHVLSHMELGPIRREVTRLLATSVTDWRITPLVIQFGRCALEKKTATIFWYYFNRTCQQVIVSDRVYPYLYAIVSAILKRYSEGYLMRELGLAFGGDSLSPAYLVRLFQRKAVELLDRHDSLDSPLGQYIWGRSIYFFNKLETNEEWQQFLEDHKDKFFRYIIDHWQGQFFDGNRIEWQRVIDMGLDSISHMASSMADDESKKEPFERFLLMRLVSVLQWVRPIIDRIVEEELRSYTPQEMTDMVRSRLYYDLQMIRINGSFVGAVLGGMFFVVAQLIREVVIR